MSEAPPPPSSTPPDASAASSSENAPTWSHELPPGTPPPAPITEQQQRWVKPILKLVSKATVWAYRASNGRVGGKFLYGSKVCLLTMKGRKSGRTLTTPLIYIPHGEDVLLVASQGGMDRHPAWYLNLVAHPDVEIQVDEKVTKMRARRATDAEKKELWPVLLAAYKDFDEYQARTERNIPVMICSPR